MICILSWHSLTLYFSLYIIYHAHPIHSPTTAPTAEPSDAPTMPPSMTPTQATDTPSISPTIEPTTATSEPTSATSQPSVSPTDNPTVPSMDPTNSPSIEPTSEPTSYPTMEPTTASPSTSPSISPDGAISPSLVGADDSVTNPSSASGTLLGVETEVLLISIGSLLVLIVLLLIVLIYCVARKRSKKEVVKMEALTPTTPVSQQALTGDLAITDNIAKKDEEGEPGANEMVVVKKNKKKKEKRDGDISESDELYAGATTTVGNVNQVGHIQNPSEDLYAINGGQESPMGDDVVVAHVNQTKMYQGQSEDLYALNGAQKETMGDVNQIEQPNINLDNMGLMTKGDDKFESSDSEKHTTKGATKSICGQCGMTKEGKLDSNDGEFYCNECWAAYQDNAIGDV